MTYPPTQQLRKVFNLHLGSSVLSKLPAVAAPIEDSCTWRLAAHFSFSSTIPHIVAPFVGTICITKIFLLLFLFQLTQALYNFDLMAPILGDTFLFV